ncbi:hypothetical protein pb186bvf_000758 [Paramecium bursaria]
MDYEIDPQTQHNYQENLLLQMKQDQRQKVIIQHFKEKEPIKLDIDEQKEIIRYQKVKVNIKSQNNTNINKGPMRLLSLNCLHNGSELQKQIFNKADIISQDLKYFSIFILSTKQKIQNKMDQLQICLQSAGSYQQNSKQLIDEIKPNNDYSKELAKEIMTYASNLFRSDDGLQQKYLMLIFLRDCEQMRVANIINGIQQLLPYFEEIATLRPNNCDINDEIRGALIHPNEDPQLAVRYLNLIILLIAQLANKYPQDSKKRPTKFYTLNQRLFSMGIQQPQDDYNQQPQDLDDQFNNQPQKQQNMQNYDNDADPRIQNIQVEMSDNIGFIYEILNQEGLQFNNVKDLINDQQRQLEQYNKELSQYLQQSNIQGQQMDYLNSLIEFSDSLTFQFNKIKNTKVHQDFIKFQHLILSSAARILNRTYTPKDEYINLNVSKKQQQDEPKLDNQFDQEIEHQRQLREKQYQKEQEERQIKQEQEERKRQQEEKFKREREEEEYQRQVKQQQDFHDQKLKEEKYKQDQLKQQIQSKQQKSQLQQQPPIEQRSQFQQSYYEQSQNNIQYQQIDEQLQNSMKLTFGSRMGLEQSQTAKQNQSQYYQDSSIQELLEKCKYNQRMINEWKKVCLLNQGTIFENDAITINCTTQQQPQILNQQMYLNIKLNFINKSDYNIPVQINYGGDKKVSFWVRNQTKILESEFNQQVISGITLSPIVGTIILQDQKVHFALPTTIYNFQEQKDIRNEIFNAKVQKVEFKSQYFQLRQSDETLRKIRFCSLANREYGAIYGNDLIKISGNYILCTNHDLLTTMAFLLS